jgi:hypothetical protein
LALAHYAALCKSSVLAGQFAEGDMVMVDLDEENKQLVFHKAENVKKKKEEPAAIEN